MSGSSYGTRPITSEPGNQPQPPGLSVSSRQIRLDPGLFSLSLVPGPTDRATGLPAVRVSLPPGPPGRREAVSVSNFRGDGWTTANDEPILLRVQPGGAEVLVTLYWPAMDASAGSPPLRLVRLNPEAPIAGPLDTVGGATASPIAIGQAMGRPVAAPPVAEIVAHIEGVGDVDGKIGDWVGMRGSGRAIEGFSLAPRAGIAPEDFEIRAILGRDWLSPWLPGGRFCGSRGLALPMRGFSLRLHPGPAVRNDLACFARFVDGSEIGPIGSDQLCAAPTMAALEAFQILMRPRIS